LHLVNPFSLLVAFLLIHIFCVTAHILQEKKIPFFPRLTFSRYRRSAPYIEVDLSNPGDLPPTEIKKAGISSPLAAVSANPFRPPSCSRQESSQPRPRTPPQQASLSADVAVRSVSVVCWVFPSARSGGFSRPPQSPSSIFLPSNTLLSIAGGCAPHLRAPPLISPHRQLLRPVTKSRMPHLPGRFQSQWLSLRVTRLPNVASN